MTAVILQARLGSTRLPRKALLPIAGISMIEHVMRALHAVGADAHILAVDPPSADELREPALRWGFDMFVGHPTDMLDRYLAAAEQFDVSRIIRATGDNPLVSSMYADRLLAEHGRAGADFSAYVGLPLGTGVEVIETAALRAAAAADPSAYEREHAGPAVHQHADRFSIHRPTVSREHHLPDARVTVDTREDYDHVCRIFDALFQGYPIGIEQLVDYLRSARGGGCVATDAHSS